MTRNFVMLPLLLLAAVLPSVTDSLSLQQQQHQHPQRQQRHQQHKHTPPPPHLLASEDDRRPLLQRREVGPKALENRYRRLFDRPDLVTMIPQQSCYYQSFNKRLTCNCNSTDTAAHLHLKMKYYVSAERGQRANEISSVFLQQCRELLVVLDLQGVDATRFPIHFRSIMKVSKKAFSVLFPLRVTVTVAAYRFSCCCIHHKCPCSC